MVYLEDERRVCFYRDWSREMVQKMAKESMKRATLHDVAQAAGVSYQTVSRVINNKPDVSAETRERILQIMREMDYRPNRAAQMLSTQRSHTLEVIMLDIRSTGTLPGMADAAAQLGYQLTFSTLTQKELEHRLDTAENRMIDGVILNAPKLKLSYERLAKLCRDIPFVQIGAEVGARKPSVVYDQKHGAKLATQHLIDLGHRQIAHIAGSSGIIDGEARHESWLETLTQNGLTPGPVIEGDFSANTAYLGVKKLLETAADFTAIFATNDWSALGAVHALMEHGLRVPEDVSIVGFDDVSPSAHFTPPLTTIRQDFDTVGKMAVEYLISLIEKPGTPVYQSVLVPELVIRQSSGRVRET
jgi:LacI family transcriptional regulator